MDKEDEISDVGSDASEVESVQLNDEGFIENEEEKIRNVNTGMTKEEVVKFVDLYMDSYNLYVPNLYNNFRKCILLIAELNSNKTVEKIEFI